MRAISTQPKNHLSLSLLLSCVRYHATEYNNHVAFSAPLSFVAFVTRAKNIIVVGGLSAAALDPILSSFALS